MEFKYDAVHNGHQAPKGIVKGTLIAAQGTYTLRFRLENSVDVFAQETEVTVGASGSIGTQNNILECQGANPPQGLRQASVIAQYKKKEETDFIEGNPRFINYRCS